jgi:hypothetical protein
VPDRIDAAVNGAEPSMIYAVVDGTRADSRVQELSPSDYSVMAVGHPDDQTIGTNIAFTHLLRG